MLVWIIAFTFYLVQGFDHKHWLSNPEKLCGPFEPGENFQKGLLEFIGSITWLSTVYSFIINYPATILIIIMLMALIKYRNDHFTLQETYVNNQVRDFLNQENQLNKLIIKKQKKIDIMEDQMAEADKERQQEEEARRIEAEKIAAMSNRSQSMFNADF